MSILRRHPSNRSIFEAQMHRWIDLGMGKERDFVNLMPHVSHAKTFLLVPRYSYVEHFDLVVRAVAKSNRGVISQIEAQSLQDNTEYTRPYLALGLADSDSTLESSARRALSVITNAGHYAYSVFEALSHLLLISPPAHDWTLPATSYKNENIVPALLRRNRFRVFSDLYRSVGYSGVETPWYRTRVQLS